MLIQIAIVAGTIFAAAPPAPSSASAAFASSDSTRTWLASELRRMPGIVTLTGCRIDFPGPGVPGAERRQESRPWRDLPLVSIRASAEGHMVRLVAADSAIRVTDNPEVAGVARRLFSSGGITLKASSEANAVRVAAELNALSLECAKAK